MPSAALAGEARRISIDELATSHSFPLISIMHWPLLAAWRGAVRSSTHVCCGNTRGRCSCGCPKRRPAVRHLDRDGCVSVDCDLAIPLAQGRALLQVSSRTTRATITNDSDFDIRLRENACTVVVNTGQRYPDGTDETSAQMTRRRARRSALVTTTLRDAPHDLITIPNGMVTP